MNPEKLTGAKSNEDWPRKELNNRRSITESKGPLGLVLTLLLIPSDGASICGPNRKSTRPLNGLGTCGAPAPMDHQQLAVHMVCSWGLVKAYQQTCIRMSISVHPPCMYSRHTTIRLTMIHTRS